MKAKLPLTPEQQLWMFKQSECLEANPMARLHGTDKMGRKCAECRLLWRKTGYRKAYFKCGLRGDTNGPGTDHRKNWNACTKFVPKSQRERWPELKPSKAKMITLVSRGVATGLIDE